MNNLGTTLAKVALLAGGAFLGALLARWCDDFLNTHTEKRSEYDRMRYAQGLRPLETRPSTEEHQG
jgi:hypothetical protein